MFGCVSNVFGSIASPERDEIRLCQSQDARPGRRFSQPGGSGRCRRFTRAAQMNENIPDPAGQARQGMDYGEHRDVQQVHAAIQREKREPRVGLEPLSIWLIAVYALAIFFGGAYLGRYSGSFSGNSLDPNPGPPVAKKAGGGQQEEQQVELTPFDRGKKVFSANCQVCHQADGLGSLSQQYPPLDGSEYTTGGSLRHAMIVLKGLHGPTTVKGVQVRRRGHATMGNTW